MKLGGDNRDSWGMYSSADEVPGNNEISKIPKIKSFKVASEESSWMAYQLLKDTKKKGKIIVYNKAFEQTRLKELAMDFPKYEKDIKNRISRIVLCVSIFLPQKLRNWLRKTKLLHFIRISIINLFIMLMVLCIQQFLL